jgi:hypothetical protein
MVRLDALMMGSRSVEMAAEVEKVRWRRRIGSGEEGLSNKYKGEHIILEQCCGSVIFYPDPGS